MIIPIVHEAGWLDFLRELPQWEPPSSPAIVLAPHPDDETLGAGGLIASLRERGVEVVVIAITNGENAYGEDRGLGEIRKVEQANALRRLGVSTDRIVRLELPDSDVTAHERELVARLLPLVSEGTHLIAPWRGDYHPDHEACGRAAEQVSHQRGAVLTSYLFWTWHRGMPDVLDRADLRMFKLSESACLAKAEALGCHRSQLSHRSGDPILPMNLLGPAQRGFEVFLMTDKSARQGSFPLCPLRESAFK